MSFTYKQVLDKAKECKKSVENEYKLGISSKNAYYFCKLILNPKLKTVPHKPMDNAPKPSGTHISNQIYKKDYLKLAEYLIEFVEHRGRLPNFIKWGNYRIRVRDYVYLFARILIYIDKNGAYPKYANINTKVWVKPTEAYEEVYNYFVKVFGKISCIDDALEYIDRKGYGYYYDDRYSNKEAIDRMKQGKGVNCTDSCHVFYNLGLALIKKGKYKKVECLHVMCRGGDGHVRLRFTLPNGEKFYRDPACTLSDGGVCNWCMDGTLLAVDPAWFKQNLSR